MVRPWRNSAYDTVPSLFSSNERKMGRMFEVFLLSFSASASSSTSPDTALPDRICCSAWPARSILSAHTTTPPKPLSKFAFKTPTSIQIT
jgi:hypothetical protein